MSILTLLLICLLQSPTLIQSDTPFGPQSKIRLDGGLRVEEGELDGIQYRFYYSDGSGTFQGTSKAGIDPFEGRGEHWRVACQKDAMTDQVMCYMHRKDLFIFVRPGGQVTLSIGNNHYPGSDVAIRIDNEPPIVMSTRIFKGSFSYNDSTKLIARISKARTITTRYQEWPRQFNRDDKWDEVYGLDQALQYLNWAVLKIK